MNSSVPFLSYTLISSERILPNTNPPNKTNIDTCLLDINANRVNPPIKNKSLNLILTFVNINNVITKVKHISNGLSSINVRGRCSLILCVVFPCIILQVYVYGISFRGVSNPVKIQITIIMNNFRTLSFFSILNLYGFFLLSFCFIMNFSKLVLDFSICLFRFAIFV